MCTYTNKSKLIQIYSGQSNSIYIPVYKRHNSYMYVFIHICMYVYTYIIHVDTTHSCTN